jgi:hypothetical protein
MYQKIKEIPYYEIIYKTNHLYVTENNKHRIIDMGYKIINGLRYYVIEMLNNQQFNKKKWMYVTVITLYIENDDLIRLIHQNIILR